MPTPRRNMYLAVAVDYSTRYANVKALPDKKSSTVAHFFEENIIARHGCPRSFRSDNGGEFTDSHQQTIPRLMN